ncbi:MAG: DNA-binding protein, partial [Actinobacteria bacterium]|nr:DNA-binding protein [Actinomycetota bacterium]
MTTVSSFLDGLHDPEALPPLTDVNRRYFAAAACGVLVFQRCANGHPFLYPRLVCPF